jgi:hypothetical protein
MGLIAEYLLPAFFRQCHDVQLCPKYMPTIRMRALVKLVNRFAGIDAYEAKMTSVDGLGSLAGLDRHVPLGEFAWSRTSVPTGRELRRRSTPSCG